MLSATGLIPPGWITLEEVVFLRAVGSLQPTFALQKSHHCCSGHAGACTQPAAHRPRAAAACWSTHCLPALSSSSVPSGCVQPGTRGVPVSFLTRHLAFGCNVCKMKRCTKEAICRTYFQQTSSVGSPVYSTSY